MDEVSRGEIDELIELASDIEHLINEIETDLYSTGDAIDENASSLRIYAMQKLSSNINDAVRYLDEQDLAHHEKKKTKRA